MDKNITEVYPATEEARKEDALGQTQNEAETKFGVPETHGGT